MDLQEKVAKLIAEDRERRKRICKRCGHEWFIKRNAEPSVCPLCKSPRWNES